VSDLVSIGIAQYPIERLASWEDYRDKLGKWVGEAAAHGAQLLVFPEFAGMELGSITDRRSIADRRSPARHLLGPLPVDLDDRRSGPNLAWEASSIEALLPRFQAVHAELAHRHDVYILAGSLSVQQPDGTLRNTAFFFSPEQTMGWQDKIVPTRWEREVGGITGGNQVKVFQTRFGPVGITICYDVEFPIIARCQAEAQARIILAPCCTDSLRGYHRVRVGARARALENQAYVIQAPALGSAPWSEVICNPVGSAGAYAPPDLGARENGVIVQGPLNMPQWVYADLDLAAIQRIRGDRVIANQDEWLIQLSAGPAVHGILNPIS
jgi:predicted amidohydrolase